MIVTTSCANAAPHDSSNRKTVRPRLVLPSSGELAYSLGRHRACADEQAFRQRPEALSDKVDDSVEVHPADAVKRHIVTWDGMAAEIVQAMQRQRMEFRFRGTRHLLVLCEQGMRSDGDTFVEGLARSTLRDVTRKLTFVPAGRAYHEWHEPRVLTRMVYFYFDPARLPLPAEATVASTPFAPRLLFEDATLFDTALKLKRLIETAGAGNSPYFQALGTVLAHELVRVYAGPPPVEAPARGGLAAWKQRVVTAYIEDHLAEPISIATLAQLAGLSPYYFCRAFKQSLGVPPLRYHNQRRMERAKLLLAKPASSVTDIGLTVGYSETSSFTAAFHKTTGLTPTAYRRTVS